MTPSERERNETSIVEAVKAAIPRVQVSTRETRHRFGFLRDLDDVIVTMPAKDWSRIVALAFSGEEGTGE